MTGNGNHTTYISMLIWGVVYGIVLPIIINKNKHETYSCHLNIIKQLYIYIFSKTILMLLYAA